MGRGVVVLCCVLGLFLFRTGVNDPTEQIQSHVEEEWREGVDSTGRSNDVSSQLDKHTTESSRDCSRPVDASTARQDEFNHMSKRSGE